MSQLLAQGAAYSILARALGEELHLLHDRTLLKELASTLESAPGNKLKKELAKLDEMLKGGGVTLDSLRAEYTRLFVKGEVSPYESSYAGRPFAELHDRADVSGFYAAVGLKPTGELPDHIVSELEFMGLLNVKEAYALAHNRREEAEVCSDMKRKFLSEHLGSWTHPLSQAVKERARLPIYPAIINLASKLIALDGNSR